MSPHLLPVFFTASGEGVLAEKIHDSDSAQSFFQRMSVADRFYLACGLRPSGGLTLAYGDELWIPAEPQRRFADIEVWRKSLFHSDEAEPDRPCRVIHCKGGASTLLTWRGARLEIDRPGLWTAPIEVDTQVLRDCVRSALEKFGHALFHLRAAATDQITDDRRQTAISWP